MKTSHIIRRLKEDTAYQEFFQKAMKKFDILSPADLKDPERKRNFFNYVDSNYSAKTEDVRGVSGQYEAALQQMKSVMQTFFQKLPLAPRDVQRDFAQLYKSVTKQGMTQLNKFEIKKIMDVLKPVLEKSGFRLKMNDRELAMAFKSALSQTKNLDTKVPASVLAEVYFPVHGADSSDMKKAKAALANWFKNSIEISMKGQPLKRSTFDILHDLIDDYAMEYGRDYADNIDMKRNTL